MPASILVSPGDTLVNQPDTNATPMTQSVMRAGSRNHLVQQLNEESKEVMSASAMNQDRSAEMHLREVNDS